MLSKEENIKRIKTEIEWLITQSHKSIYVIIDGDRTLIPTDSTKFFFKYLQLEYTDIKDIFQQQGYSFEAFYNVALYYSNIEEKNTTVPALKVQTK